LSAEARVHLDHRAAAPVPAEPRVKVQDPRRLVPVPFPAQLHGKLRHGGSASTAPRRADHRDVRPQSQPAWQGQQDAAASAAELRARPHDRGRAPRRAGTRGRRRGGGRRGGGEDVAEEAAAGPEGARGGRVQRRGGVERAHVEGGDGQPPMLPGRRSGLLRRARVGGAEGAVGGVQGEGCDRNERGEGEEQQHRAEAARAALPAHGRRRRHVLGFREGGERLSGDDEEEGNGARLRGGVRRALENSRGFKVRERRRACPCRSYIFFFAPRVQCTSFRSLPIAGSCSRLVCLHSRRCHSLEIKDTVPGYTIQLTTN
jgi:hypothetical protein